MIRPHAFVDGVPTNSLALGPANRLHQILSRTQHPAAHPPATDQTHTESRPPRA